MPRSHIIENYKVSTSPYIDKSYISRVQQNYIEIQQITKQQVERKLDRGTPIRWLIIMKNQSECIVVRTQQPIWH